MDILLVQPIGHRIGGVSADIALFSDAFSMLEVDVTLVTFDGILVNPKEKVRQITFCENHRTTAPFWKFLDKNFRIGSILELNTWLDTFLTLSLVSKLAKKKHYDAIHILESHPLLLPLIRLSFSLKDEMLLLTVRSTRYSDNERNKKFKDAINKRDYKQIRGLIVQKIRDSNLANIILKYLFIKAKQRNRIALICESQGVKESYKDSFLAGDFNYIPIGISETMEILPKSIARKYLKLATNKTVLLSFGVNHRQKNLGIVFKAISSLPKNFTIIYAGKIDHGLTTNDPELLSKQYGLSDNTIINDGFIPQEDTKYYFSAADVIILSYTKDFLHGSGVLSFATGYELPVIASDIGQLGEFVRTKQLGLTFTPEDPISLRQAIIDFLKLPESEYKQMKNNLRTFAASNSWEVVAKKHLELYRNLANGNKGA